MEGKKTERPLSASIDPHSSLSLTPTCLLILITLIFTRLFRAAALFTKCTPHPDLYIKTNERKIEYPRQQAGAEAARDVLSFFLFLFLVQQEIVQKLIIYVSFFMVNFDDDGFL